MAASSKPRQKVSTLLPSRENKVCDSSTFQDESGALSGASVDGKSSSGCGKKVMRPLRKLKKAFVEILVSEPSSPHSYSNGNARSSLENPAHWSALSVGMGMVPVTDI